MDIVFKSLASAIITAIILLIAKFSGPRIAGAIGGIPLVFAISYVLLTVKDRGISREFLIGGIYGGVASIIFCLVLILLNMFFIKLFWLNFAIAYILCFLFALGAANYTAK